jgi:DNA (cytosine-5)-methyltransferase 1
LGNAVPSALAEVLARAIRGQLLGHKIDLSASLSPVPRVPLPEPELPRPVPRKYYDLVGKHEAHPGTGKGYAAIRRKDDNTESAGEVCRPTRLASR